MDEVVNPNDVGMRQFEAAFCLALELVKRRHDPESSDREEISARHRAPVLRRARARQFPFRLDRGP